MAYLDDIPNASDLLAISQAQIKENFSQLETQFSVDHDSLLAAGATGKHVQITLPQFDAGADPVTAAGEGMLYTKDSGTQPELYYREESAGDIIQLTSGGTASYVSAFCAFTFAGISPFSPTGTAYNVGANAIVRNGAGDYTITFTNALPDANYTLVGCGSDDRLLSIFTKLAGSVRVRLRRGGSNSLSDGEVNITIFHI